MYSFQIIQVDVGQGDCTVIIIRNGPNGNTSDPIVLTIVIDCGGGNNGVNADDTNSGTSLLRVLNDHNVEKIDIVNISHYDQDHLGGIRALLKRAKSNSSHERFRLRQLFQSTCFYDRGEPGNYDSYNGNFTNNSVLYTNYITDLYDLRNNHNLNVRRMTEFVSSSYNATIDLRINNPKFTTVDDHTRRSFRFYPLHTFLGVDLLSHSELSPIPEITLTCITVNRYVWDMNGLGSGVRLPSTATSGENHRSMTLLFQFGNYNHWLSGELLAIDENACIQTLQANCYNGQLNSMKLGHHGSKNSTSDILIDALHVDTVLISCGPDNTYEHPDSGVLDVLFSRNVKVLLTGWGGDPHYLEEVRYFQPSNLNSSIQIAGSTAFGLDTPGDIQLISNEQSVLNNTFARHLFLQNRWYHWEPDPHAPLPPFMGQQDVLPGDAFLELNGDLLAELEITPTGGIIWINEHGERYPGIYIPEGGWALI